jgi:hypothetical protein
LVSIADRILTYNCGIVALCVGGEIMSDQQGVAAVDRALRLLKVFTVRQPIHTLASIAAATGYYKSTILRICASLLNAGYLVRLPDGTYCLGPEALRMGSAYQKSFRLADVVYNALESLVASLSESASYYVRDGNQGNRATYPSLSERRQGGQDRRFIRLIEASNVAQPPALPYGFNGSAADHTK